jgi:hypothetical protein
MSSKPIVEKLHIKQGKKVLLVNEPKDYRLKLGKLPTSATVTDKPAEETFDVIQVFVYSKTSSKSITKTEATFER